VVAILDQVPKSHRARDLPKVADLQAKWNWSLPLVSVLMSSYNSRDFIEDALSGILMQKTSFPFELVVRDDASTDGTQTIVQEFVDAYPGVVRAELLSHNSYARIRPEVALLGLAKGQYVAWCDADDYWARDDKIQRQATVLLESSGVVLTHHLAVKTDRTGQTMLGTVPRESQRRYMSRVEARYGPKVLGSTVMHRNLAVEPVTANSWMAQSGDFMLFQLLTEHGDIHWMQDFAGVVRRVHEGSSLARQPAFEVQISRALSRIFLARANGDRGRADEASHLAIDGTSRLLQLFLSTGILAHRQLVRLLLSIVWLRVKKGLLWAIRGRDAIRSHLLGQKDI